MPRTDRLQEIDDREHLRERQADREARFREPTDAEIDAELARRKEDDEQVLFSS